MEWRLLLGIISSHWCRVLKDLRIIYGPSLFFWPISLNYWPGPNYSRDFCLKMISTDRKCRKQVMMKLIGLSLCDIFHVWRVDCYFATVLFDWMYVHVFRTMFGKRWPLQAINFIWENMYILLEWHLSSVTWLQILDLCAQAYTVRYRKG